MIIFDIDWPKLISRILKLMTKGFVKLEQGKQKVRDLMKWLPKGKVGDVYENSAHRQTPGGMIEHSLDPMKLDPSRDLPSRTIDDIFDEKVEEGIKEAGKEAAEIIREEVEKARANPKAVIDPAQVSSWAEKLKSIIEQAAKNQQAIAEEKKSSDKSEKN